MPPKEITRTQPTMDATPAGQIHQPFVQPARAADFEAGQASGGEQGELRAPAALGDAPPLPTGKPPTIPAPPPKQLPTNSQKPADDEIQTSVTHSSKHPDKSTSKSKPSHHSGGEQGTAPKTKPTDSNMSISKHTENSQDPALLASQEADTLAQAAVTAADIHAKAVQEIARLTEIWEAASTELQEAEAAKKAVEPPNKATPSLIKAAVMNWETARNKQAATFLEVQTANRAEHKASMAANQALHAAHLAQNKAEELLMNKRLQKTSPPEKPNTASHPLGPKNPSIFVEIIPLPKPGIPLDGPMPYTGVSTDMGIRYRTMEKWVHNHAAHIHVMNDIFPGREIALGWLKIIKQMKTSTEELMQKCHTPADVKTAALMIKWLAQLRKCIGNIGRVKAAREGVIAEMDDIHTDDELAQPAESQKSQSRHPSKTRDIPTAPARTATVYQMEQSHISTLANSKDNQGTESSKKQLTIIAYSAAPPSTPLFVQYVATSDRTIMEAKLVTVEKQQKDLLKFVDDFIAPDKNIETISAKVYRDKLDMTELCPSTKEVNNAIAAINNYPVGSYSPEDGYKVHVVATLFEDSTIPRVMALVLARIIYRDYGNADDRVIKVKDHHVKTLATLLVIINQHVAFRKNRYRIANRTYLGVTFPNEPNTNLPPPPPPPKPSQQAMVHHNQPLTGRRKSQAYTVQTPGSTPGLGFRRGGIQHPNNRLLIQPPKNTPRTPAHELDTQTPLIHNTPQNDIDQEASPHYNQAQIEAAAHDQAQTGERQTNQDKQIQADIMPEDNNVNNNQTNKHLYTQPPNYNNMNHQANHPQQPNRRDQQPGGTGHAEVTEFPSDKRGKFEFYGNAPERWPAYAHHFMYQPNESQTLDQYIEVPGARQNFKVRAIQWQLSETLKVDADYPDWDRNVFQFKLKADSNIVNHVFTYVTALWAGLHPGLQETLEANIDKTAGDNAVPTAIFMANFWRKEGALEWLLFNLSKVCRCHQDDRRQKAIKILTNATVTANADNVAKVLNEIIAAGDLICGEGSDKFPYSWAVEQMVRSLQYCHVNNASAAIRERQVEVHYFDDDGQERKRWLCFDITSTRDEQTDKLLNGDIDWKGRWTEIKQTARQLVTSLSSTIHQNPRAHEYYPVFIKDWAPIEVIGVTRGAGPKPPSHQAYYYTPDAPNKTMKRPRADFESPNRSRDSRPHVSGYESDTRSYKTYDSKRSNHREDRNKRKASTSPDPAQGINNHPPVRR
jgi:hypothetical protein